MTYVLGALVLASIMAQIAAFWAMDRRRPRPPAHAPSPETGPPVPPGLELFMIRLGAAEADVARLQVQVQALPQLWDEAADRAERSAEKARKSAARARERALNDEREQPEQDVGQLHLVDGTSGGQLSAVQRQVAPSPLDVARAEVGRAMMQGRL